MSAEIPSVTLVGSSMVPLVKAAGALQADDVPPFAVVGGVAVAVRLGRVMRATADLDAVTDYRYTPTALEILQRRPDARYEATDPHTVIVDGTQIQFQDVTAVTDEEVEHLDPKNMLYVTSHAHALISATSIVIMARDKAKLVQATVPIATAGALVAMKLHAYLDRRGTAGHDKRPGDLWDIYNLLLLAGADAASDVGTGGRMFQQVVISTVREHLIDGATKARSVLRSSNDDRYQAITAAEFAFAASDFVDRLTDTPA